jgi:hypothetical protein
VWTSMHRLDYLPPETWRRRRATPRYYALSVAIPAGHRATGPADFGAVAAQISFQGRRIQTPGDIEQPERDRSGSQETGLAQDLHAAPSPKRELHSGLQYKNMHAVFRSFAPQYFELLNSAQDGSHSSAPVLFRGLRCPLQVGYAPHAATDFRALGVKSSSFLCFVATSWQRVGPDDFAALQPRSAVYRSRKVWGHALALCTGAHSLRRAAAVFR